RPGADHGAVPRQAQRGVGMSESLLPYYESELRFIRELAQEFAAHYPTRAGRLGLSRPQAIDPQVERLIEAFALLTGRIRHKLDDDFPELTDALLSVLYPHYLAPIPSLGIIHLDPLPGADLAPGHRVERGSALATDPVGYQDVTKVGGGRKELSCRFRTCYPVTLWPVRVSSAALTPPPFPEGVPVPTHEESKAILRMRLDCQAATSFAQLGDPADPARRFDRLRFYLDGDAPIVTQLYELLFTGVIRVLLLPTDKGSGPVVLRPEECLFPVGFAKDEGALPYAPQSFLGYRLLTEFFAFPRKFFFFDLGGLDRARHPRFGRQLDVIFFLRRTVPALVTGVKPETFRLGCTPVVNLFEQAAEPITVTQATHEYRVVPSYAQEGGMEVYAVDRVSETDQVTGATKEYRPFYSFRHGGPEARGRAFWCATRRESLAGPEAGSDVYLSLVDLDFRPWTRQAPVLQVQTTCTNRELARNLLREGDRIGLDFHEGEVAPARVRWAGALTPPVRPPRGDRARWRLLSHLSLNHLSLAHGEEGLDSLKEILRLYDFAEGTADLVEGLLSVAAGPVVERVAGGPASGFARGVKVALEFDRQRCLGTGVYLFASVLEHFLGLYTSINSFTQLVARVRNEKGELKRWPPRAGTQQLL
ncbi:MAG TPA: type VI secretion system baseplate subunit TssF, partial [Gemmataceae bacterium]|nr:type VI secretion system baseplate subunit TssF [Gemmataceae bacterium]